MMICGRGVVPTVAAIRLITETGRQDRIFLTISKSLVSWLQLVILNSSYREAAYEYFQNMLQKKNERERERQKKKHGRSRSRSRPRSISRPRSRSRSNPKTSPSGRRRSFSPKRSRYNLFSNLEFQKIIFF